MLGLLMSLASHSLPQARKSGLAPGEQEAPARRSRSGEGPGAWGIGNGEWRGGRGEITLRGGGQRNSAGHNCGFALPALPRRIWSAKCDTANLPEDSQIF